MRRYIQAAVLVALTASAAEAQDLSGPYGGLYLRLDLAPYAITRRIDGAAGGFAGYIERVGDHVVLGVEGDITYDWRNTNLTPATRTVTGTARLRAGVDTGLGALLYGTGGFGFETGGVGPVWELGAGFDIGLGPGRILRTELTRQAPFTATSAPRTNAVVGIGLRF